MTTRTARRVFAAPLVLALISAIGLLAALLGDDLWDALSWATLGLPIALIAVLLVRTARHWQGAVGPPSPFETAAPQPPQDEG